MNNAFERETNRPVGDAILPVHNAPASIFKAGRHVFELGKRTYVMGILNVTPDSFSDGGQFNTIEHALRQAERMVESGADILDIGGESTRPGAIPVPVQEEIERVAPVIEQISRRFPTPISVDTFKSQTASAALAAGAVIVNDIFGLRADPGMAGVIAATDAGAVLMHHPGLADSLKTEIERQLDSSDWPSRMQAYLRVSLQIAAEHGISRDRLMTDPGIGFAMSPETSVDVLRQCGSLSTLGLPFLIGTSRKRMIAHLLGGRPIESRLMGTAASVCFAITAGADFVRVHDVAEIVDTVRVMDALYRKRS